MQAYFSYQAVTQNKFYAPDRVSFPELHYCFRYLDDVLDWSAIWKKYGKPNSTMKDARKWLDVITIKDIFDYTPNVSIDECLHRDATGHTFEQKWNDCDIFSVSKYVQQQYVCYRLATKENNSYDFKFIYNSLYKERLLYEIKYSGILSTGKKIRATLTEHLFVYISNFYTPAYYSKTGTGFSLQLSCSKFKNNFIGFPYDNFFCEKPNEDHFECIEECLKTYTMKYWNRIPFYSFHQKPIEAKMISGSMMENKTNLKYMTVWYEKCQISCPMHPCHYSYCITHGHEDHPGISNSLSKNGGIKSASSIKVLSPRSPDINITYVPSLPFLDFIIFIFSTFGTWFGLVIVSLNPISVVEQIYRILMSKLANEDYEKGPFPHYNSIKKKKKSNQKVTIVRRFSDD